MFALQSSSVESTCLFVDVHRDIDIDIDRDRDRDMEIDIDTDML